MIKFLIKCPELILFGGLIIGGFLGFLNFYIFPWDLTKPYVFITSLILLLGCFVGSTFFMTHLQCSRKYQDIRCECNDHEPPEEIDKIERSRYGYRVIGRCPRCGKKITTLLNQRISWREENEERN